MRSGVQCLWLACVLVFFILGVPETSWSQGVTVSSDTVAATLPRGKGECYCDAYISDFPYGPMGVMASPDGTMYVVETSGRIHRISSNGECETTVYVDDYFDTAFGLAVDATGHIYADVSAASSGMGNYIVQCDRSGNVLGFLGPSGDLRSLRDGRRRPTGQQGGFAEATKKAPELFFQFRATMMVLESGQIGIGRAYPRGDTTEEVRVYQKDACGRLALREDKELVLEFVRRRGIALELAKQLRGDFKALQRPGKPAFGTGLAGDGNYYYFVLLPESLEIHRVTYSLSSSEDEE